MLVHVTPFQFATVSKTFGSVCICMLNAYNVCITTSVLLLSYLYMTWYILLIDAVMLKRTFTSNLLKSGHPNLLVTSHGMCLTWTSLHVFTRI